MRRCRVRWGLDQEARENELVLRVLVDAAFGGKSRQSFPVARKLVQAGCKKIDLEVGDGFTKMVIAAQLPTPVNAGLRFRLYLPLRVKLTHSVVLDQRCLKTAQSLVPCK
jgi:hypothetical protein